MQTVEDFKKDIASGGEALKRAFGEHTASAERYIGDKNSLVWHTYTRNRDLQKRFIEEVQYAVSMPDLAPEVLGMRYRLWQEFVAAVEALGGAPVQVQEVSETKEEEQDLTVYKDKHPAKPREDDIVVRKPQTLGVRIKPKPNFAQAAPAPKKVEVKQEQPKPEPVASPKPAPKKMEVPKPKKPVESMESKKAVPVTDEVIEKVKKSIIERVGKNSQGFLDGIFGSLGNENAGLSKVEGLTLADIIEIEKLSPDAHTAKLDDLGVTQKEWEGWIDWVNESNRVVTATVSATLGQYLDQVARHIAGKK